MDEKTTHRHDFLLLAGGLLSGLVIGTLLSQRHDRARRMPDLPKFQQALSEERSVVETAFLAGQAQFRYAKLLEERPRFANAALRSHLEDNILLGLALYQTLLAAHGSQDAALAEMEQLLVRTQTTGGKIMRALGHLPAPFQFFRRATRWVTRFGFPSEGWEITWREDNPHCIAFDITRCFYLEMLTAYDAPELTPLYCQLDDWMYGQLPAPITWLRTTTLARGGDRCDFRWCV